MGGLWKNDHTWVFLIGIGLGLGMPLTIEWFFVGWTLKNSDEWGHRGYSLRLILAEHLYSIAEFWFGFMEKCVPSSGFVFKIIWVLTFSFFFFLLSLKLINLDFLLSTWHLYYHFIKKYYHFSSHISFNYTNTVYHLSCKHFLLVSYW